LQLINEGRHYQNALLALGTLQRTRRTGSQKAARVFLRRIAGVEFFASVSQLIKMAPSILKNTVNIVFWAIIVCVTLLGISSADIHYVRR
jgi:hypothetical protein